MSRRSLTKIAAAASVAALAARPGGLQQLGQLDGQRIECRRREQRFACRPSR